MKFRKPLRAFISYSHKDSALCREFITHFKPLIDDGIFEKAWHDGKLTAGIDWDKTIRRELEEAHLFIALTSAEFNASGYIEGIEMRRAEERHRSGSCRIVHVMLKSWRPPARLQTWQFLPGLKTAVASAKKRDDVWATIVERIETVADEMVDGKWREAEEPQTGPRMSTRLGRHLAYLCNWREPIHKIRTALQCREGEQRLPAVVILVATRDDAPDRFTDRLATRELSNALGLGSLKLEPEIKRFDWVSSLHLEIHNSLSSDDRLPIERKLREGLTVLITTETGDGWTAKKEDLLVNFLRYWRDWGPLPGLRGLVSIISLIRSDRDPEFLRHIEALTQRETDPTVRTAVVELPRVLYSHAVNWPAEPEVKKRYRADAEQDLREDILGLFSDINEPLPMTVLAPQLLALLERYPEESTARVLVR